MFIKKIETLVCRDNPNTFGTLCWDVSSSQSRIDSLVEHNRRRSLHDMVDSNCFYAPSCQHISYWNPRLGAEHSFRQSRSQIFQALSLQPQYGDTLSSSRRAFSYSIWADLVTSSHRLTAFYVKLRIRHGHTSFSTRSRTGDWISVIANLRATSVKPCSKSQLLLYATKIQKLWTQMLSLRNHVITKNMMPHP